jgi:hypothetical protein
MIHLPLTQSEASLLNTTLRDRRTVMEGLVREAMAEARSLTNDPNHAYAVAEKRATDFAHEIGTIQSLIERIRDLTL